MRAPAKTVETARWLRREMTLPESVLWQRLRRGGIHGLRFRRQHPIGPYVLDFFCAPARLAAEVDGAAHHDARSAAHDDRRDRWLSEQGVRVLRFAAADVLKDERLQGVLDAIAAVVAEAPSTTLRAVPLPR